MEQTSGQRIDIEKMCCKWKAERAKTFAKVEKEMEQIQVRIQAARKAREAERKAYEKMMVERKADQEKREAERKARQDDLQKMIDADQVMAYARARPKEITDKIKEDMKNDRKESMACQEAMKANPEKMEPTDSVMAILEKMIATMKASQEKIGVMDLKGNSEQMECESEHRETAKEDAVVKKVNGRKKRHRGRKLAAGDTKVYQGMTACQKPTEADMENIEPDPRMVQSALEHQEIPTEDVAVMPVKGLRKRRRVWKLAVERRQKPKERNRGFCGSWKRVTVCRQKDIPPYNSGMAKNKTLQTKWDSVTLWIVEDICRRQQRNGLLCRSVTARGKRWQEIRPGQCGTGNQETTKGRKKLRKHPECNKGLKDLGLRQQLQDPDPRQQLHLRIEKSSNEIFREKIAKRVVRTSNGLRKIRKWTLWRCRPPPKQTKMLHTE
jgi:hypothetical protein